jgi:ATP-dependent Zn protease
MILTRRSLRFWLVVVICAIVLFEVTKGNNRPPQEISYPELLSQIEAGNVATVTIKASQVDGVYGDHRTFRAPAPENLKSMLALLVQKKVGIRYEDAYTGGGLLELVPLALLACLGFFLTWLVNARQKRKLSDNPNSRSNSLWSGK